MVAGSQGLEANATLRPKRITMRIVLQRVSRASVDIDGARHAEIGRGLLVLLGITHDDTREDAQWLASKIARMRIFSDGQGLMNLSVGEVGGGILVVSQFTLHGSTRKGNRPSFIRAAPPERAVPLYEEFLKILEEEGVPVKAGVFGANMEVALVNHGPVTLIVDSRHRE